jgi:hypothetical protein
MFKKIATDVLVAMCICKENVRSDTEWNFLCHSFLISNIKSSISLTYHIIPSSSDYILGFFGSKVEKTWWIATRFNQFCCKPTVYFGPGLFNPISFQLIKVCCLSWSELAPKRGEQFMYSPYFTLSGYFWKRQTTWCATHFSFLNFRLALSHTVVVLITMGEREWPNIPANFVFLG